MTIAATIILAAIGIASAISLADSTLRAASAFVRLSRELHR